MEEYQYELLILIMVKSYLKPCAVCTKSVGINQRGIFCDACHRWVHISCAGIDIHEYQNLSVDDSVWFCTLCLEGMFPFNCITDDFEFNKCLYSFAHCDRLRIDQFHCQAQLNIVNDTYVVNFDIDPDFNCPVISKNNAYFLPHEFRDYIDKLSLSDESFSILHINARSLNNKMEEFGNFVRGLQFKFTTIVVTETWANNINESNFVISGYSYCGKPRIGSRGGGVAIYVKDGLDYTIRSDLDALVFDACELIIIQLSNDNIVRNIVAVYRPPGSNLIKFNASYCKLLDKLKC